MNNQLRTRRQAEFLDSGVNAYLRTQFQPVDPTQPAGYWQWAAAAWHPRRGGEIVLKTVYRWVWLYVPRT